MRYEYSKCKKSITCALLLATLALMQSAYGGAECASLGGGCDDGGDWDPMAKLDEIGTGIYDQAQASANWPAESRKQRWNMSSGSEDSQEEDGAASAIQEDVRADLSAGQSTSRWHEIMMRLMRSQMRMFSWMSARVPKSTSLDL